MSTRSAAPSDAALEELLDNVLAEVGPTGPISQDVERIYVSRGDLVADKYLVEGLLGEGGMAFVIVAKHVKLGEKVALKFLHKQFLEKADLVERFAREAQAASRIKNEHVARVYDVGSIPLTNPTVDAPFLVMEYLEGHDVCTEIQTEGPFAIADAVELTMQACQALAVAHAQGIVHRDIKPENLFLVGKGTLRAVKVLDFGISKLALTGKAFAEAEKSLTGSLTLGTPLYMSPEQIRSSRSVDPRSDIWSLGIVLYEMLTAKTAFDADSVTELCAAVLETSPKPILELRPEVPPGLAAIVARCYEKEPANRFQNVAELSIALLKYAPKRARLTAERTSQVIRAARPTAGSQHELDIPETLPPPNDGSLNAMAVMPTPAELRPLALPHVESLGDVGSTTVTTRRLSPPDSKPSPALWVGAIALLAVALGLAFWFSRGDKPAATDTPAPTTSVVQANVTPPVATNTTAASTAAATKPATTTEPRPAALGTRPVVGRPGAPAHAVPAHTAPVTAVVVPVPTTAPAPTPTSTVKRNPDLGY
ncbi:MAG: serine/threonine protein kinase [Myxococcaceae bacterium]|nr:serine/threonine protein kinase [Myxococcaceae bacterium]